MQICSGDVTALAEIATELLGEGLCAGAVANPALVVEAVENVVGAYGGIKAFRKNVNNFAQFSVCIALFDEMVRTPNDEQNPASSLVHTFNLLVLSHALFPNPLDFATIQGAFLVLLTPSAKRVAGGENVRTAEGRNAILCSSRHSVSPALHPPPPPSLS